MWEIKNAMKRKQRLQGKASQLSDIHIVPACLGHFQFYLSEELCRLGRKDLCSFIKQQMNLILWHFLYRTGSPESNVRSAVPQWPCDADEQKQKLILKSQTAFSTFQGDWVFWSLA